MSNPIPLSQVNSKYLFYPSNEQSSFNWKRTYVPMAYELDPNDFPGYSQRNMLATDENLNIRAYDNGLLIRNISLNFLKQIPNMDHVVYIGNRQDETQTNKDVEFIPYDHLNQDCNLIVAVGDYKVGGDRDVFNSFYHPDYIDVEAVLKSINGNIVSVFRVNWDGEPGSTETHNLPDILLRPGQSLWFFAYYTFQQFDGIVLDGKYSSNGSIRLNINLFFDQQEIEAKTIYGYPFPQTSTIWDWPGKDEALNGNPQSN